jgi:hypothetical protein
MPKVCDKGAMMSHKKGRGVERWARGARCLDVLRFASNSVRRDARGSYENYDSYDIPVMNSLAPARSALAGLWLRQMEPPLLPSVSHDRDCRCRDMQTFRLFPSGSSATSTMLQHLQAVTPRISRLQMAGGEIDKGESKWIKVVQRRGRRTAAKSVRALLQPGVQPSPTGSKQVQAFPTSPSWSNAPCPPSSQASTRQGRPALPGGSDRIRLGQTASSQVQPGPGKSNR